MKIFIDSARLDEIEQAYSYGIINGVTTNPSLLKKAVDKLQKSGEKITLQLEFSGKFPKVNSRMRYFGDNYFLVSSASSSAG